MKQTLNNCWQNHDDAHVFLKRSLELRFYIPWQELPYEQLSSDGSFDNFSRITFWHISQVERYTCHKLWKSECSYSEKGDWFLAYFHIFQFVTVRFYTQAIIDILWGSLDTSNRGHTDEIMHCKNMPLNDFMAPRLSSVAFSSFVLSARLTLEFLYTFRSSSMK